MKSMQEISQRLALLGMVLLALPACEIPFFSKGTEQQAEAAPAASAAVTASEKGGVVAGDKTNVLVTINGKPEITEASLNEKIKQMLQADPMTAAIDPATLPPVAKQKFLHDWIQIITIKQVWDVQTGTSTTDAFKVDLAKRTDALKDQLIVEKFVETLKTDVKVADKAINDEYRTNKEQRYIKVAGGTRVVGAKFDDKKDAEAFLTNVSKVTATADFEKKAKDNAKAKYRDFGRLSKGVARGVPAELVNATVEEKASTTKLVVAGNENWVVLVLDKKDAEFYTLDEVKPQVKAMLEGQAFTELLNKKLEELKKNMKIEIAKEYQMNADMAAQMAQMEQMMQQQQQ